MTETLAALAQILFVELALFAAVGFVLGGIDELLVDGVWLVRAGWRRMTIYRRHKRTFAADLPDPPPSFRLAVFVPAWQEADVIAPMLRRTLASYSGVNFTLFVGCYPNDPATAAAARSIVSPHIRVVIGDGPGPTTKADNLNALWRALAADGVNKFDAVCLHDAEDWVSPFEARIASHLLPRFGLLQLPVVPLIDDTGRWISGHYCDEFAEAHGKTLPVREALGATLPLAGVGCILRVDVLDSLAAASGNAPFDPDSLTEDYEAGIKLGGTGCASAFVRMLERPGGPLVATRAYFPADLEAAIKQKSRWMIGIGISGWDRIGWGTGLVENWMRLRDRLGLLTTIVLCAAYLASIPCVLLLLSGVFGGPRLDIPPLLAGLIGLTTALLAWRLAVRAYFVWKIYGPGEALRSVPRAFLANFIAIFAARRAVARYLTMLRRGALEWDKTAHRFPDQTT